jgi:hypothetical protein
MVDWKVTAHGKKPNLNNPILIEGLPGMGNVGKIAVDFLIEVLDAKKFLDLYSYHLPNSVFIGEDGLIEVPSISFYSKKTKDQDYLFLAGDVQPLDEASSHTFCHKVLEILKDFNGTEVVTLGGIGLPEAPKKPKVYVTANDKKTKDKYSVRGVNKEIYGVVGPIIGVSGLLLGVAQKHDTPAASLLAQTFGHPNYVGVRGARALVKVLSSALKLDIDLTDLDKEIKDMESDLKKVSPLKLPQSDEALDAQSNVSYIG